MLYHLKNLDSIEQEVVMSAPIWVTLLIACADYDIEEKEIDRAKEIIHIKSFAEQSDVRALYQELDANLDEKIDDTLRGLSAEGKKRIAEIEGHLSKLNAILPKLDHTYAVQFRNSLENLAVHVAQSDGGFFGVKRISEEEGEFIHLPMIDRL